MKKFLKYLSGSLFFILGIVLIIFVYKQFPISSVLNTFNSTSIWPVIAFIAVSIIIMAFHTWRWDIILRTSNFKIPFYKLFMYKTVGFGISFITPFAKVGGEPLRGMLLAKHDCPFDKGMATIIIDKIIDLATTGLMFALGVFIAISTIALPNSIKTVLIIISIVFLAMIASVYYQLLNNKQMIFRWYKRLRLHKIKKLRKYKSQLIAFDKKILKFHKEQQTAFYKAVAISVITWLLMFVEYSTVLWMFNYHLGLIQLFTIITIMGAAYVFPIPLALGVFEFGQAQTFSMLGLKPAAGIVLSIIIRARDLMWTLFAIIILLAHGKSFKKAYLDTLKEPPLINSRSSSQEKKKSISPIKGKNVELTKKR